MIPTRSSVANIVQLNSSVIPIEAARSMTSPTDTTGVQAVLFALQILEHVAVQRDAIGVTTLAEHFGTNKSRIFRHLKTLAQQGYVVQDAASERYRVGARLVAMCHAVNDNIDIVREAEPVMRHVRNTLHHSVVLSMMDRGGVRVVAVQPGDSPVEITVRPGSLLAHHSSAQGKIAVAFGNSELVKAVFGDALPALTPETIIDSTTLQAELAQIRQRGWSVAPNQSVTGLNALAAPIFDATGQLAGTIAIVDTVQLITANPNELQISTMVSASQRISESIGFRPGGRMKRT
jgi:IclR family transcriptional regulator, KDG regulon repressor